MNLDDLPPPELMWEGKFIRALKRGKWEFASRARDIRAVVILAEHEGKLILVDQPRAGPDCRCVELPAGLVGDQDPNATIESTAIKELEEETGFTGESVERLGDFYSSPGMLAEAFTLVRVHGLRRIGEASTGIGEWSSIQSSFSTPAGSADRHHELVAREVMTVPNIVVSVWRSGAALETSTVSLTCTATG